MSLRINNNISAFNAHRNLGISDDMLSRSLEKLSSGYKINRAADDAAGLAISEGLRANIRSYRKAIDNTNQATSLLQVAEGAMNEIGNILQRLKELATQASSANVSSSDRTKLDAESTQLEAEINRIADSTKYGSTVLINGAFGAASSIGVQDLSTVGISAGSKINVSSVIDTSARYTINDAAGTAITLTNGTVTQTIYVSGTGAQTINFTALGVKIELDANYSASNELDAKFFTVSSATQRIWVGSTGTASTDSISVSLGDLNTAVLANGASFDADLSTLGGAQSALDNIDTAISYVATKRGDVGATQSRLLFAAASISVTIENTIAAESIIRDADMAFEMTTFTKNQVLLQAGNAMLAQANMMPQLVLKLLG